MKIMLPIVRGRTRLLIHLSLSYGEIGWGTRSKLAHSYGFIHVTFKLETSL